MFPPVEIVDTIDFYHTPLFKDKSFLYQKYVVEGRSCDEIAAQIFSARTTILKYLKAHKIPVKEVGQNIIKRRHVAYGKRMLRRTEVTHLKELATINKMHVLRNQGFSYWKIADILNSMGIRTKTNRGRWHARTIQKILSKDK